MTYDVIIIGGSYAGLSAAMQLGRARRQVLVIDEGVRRNRFAEHSHGFLTQDGEKPEIIAAEARAQVMEYATVEWLSARAELAEKLGSGFSVTAAGRSYSARRLVLATGVTDHLPDVQGLSERWGKSVFHCPYCHGFELNMGRIGVIAVSALSMHQALMLPDWGETHLLLNGRFEPDAEQRSALDKRGVTVERCPIAGIEGNADVRFEDGRLLAFAGLFVLPRIAVTGAIAAQLGCEFEENPLGSILKTDAMKETSVPGVFACGDVARLAASVAGAIGDGNFTGAVAHQSLIFRPE